MKALLIIILEFLFFASRNYVFRNLQRTPPVDIKMNLLHKQSAGCILSSFDNNNKILIFLITISEFSFTIFFWNLFCIPKRKKDN